MPKNRFLSTTNAASLLSSDEKGRRAAINISGQALGVAQQNFENKINAAEQEARQTRAKGQLASEKKRQAELSIPAAARNIQRAQLNTFNTILGLQEAARQEAETKEAHAFSLQTNNQTSLDFLKAQRDITSKAGPDGSGLLESTKQWWDTQEEAIIANAPSEKAKLKALETFYAKKTDALGNAVMGEMAAKDSFIKRQLQSSQDSLIAEVRFNPSEYENSLKGFDAIEANLVNNGFSKEQVAAQKKLFSKNLLNTKLESELERAALNPALLKSVEQTLSSEENRSLLGDSNVEKLVKNYFTQGEKANNSLRQSEQELRMQDKWLSGSLSTGNPKDTKFVAKQFEASHQGIEQQISQISDPKERAAAYNSYKLTFAKSAPFIPQGEVTNSEFRLLNTQDPNKAVAEANYILNLSRDKETITKFKGYSTKALTRATLIDNYTKVQGLSPEAAIEAVNGDLARQLDGNAIKGRQQSFEQFKKGEVKGDIYNNVFNEDAMDLVERIHGDVDQSFLFGFGNHLEEEANQLKFEYIAELEEVYNIVGNEKQAIEVTDSIMRQKIGVTIEDGIERLMMNPPEQVFTGKSKEYFDQVKTSKFEMLRSAGTQDDMQLAFESVDGDRAVYKIINAGSKLPVMESVNGYEQEARLKVSLKGGQQFALAKERQAITNPTSSWREFFTEQLKEDFRIPFTNEKERAKARREKTFEDLNPASRAFVNALFPKPMTLKQQEEVFGAVNPDYIAEEKEKLKIIDEQLEGLNG